MYVLPENVRGSATDGQYTCYAGGRIVDRGKFKLKRVAPSEVRQGGLIRPPTINRKRFDRLNQNIRGELVS
jgi:hypothetical protein